MSRPSPAYSREEKPSLEGVSKDLPFSFLLLRGIIAGLGMVLVAGFTGLIIMLTVTFYRLSSDQNPAGWPVGQTIALEHQQSITGTSLSGKYLLIHTQKAGKPDAVLIHDTSTGQLATKIQVVQEAAPHHDTTPAAAAVKESTPAAVKPVRKESLE